jgi:hypothetical protein
MFQGQQGGKADRAADSRVPFGEAVRLDRVEPAAEAFLRRRRLLTVRAPRAARAARGCEGGVRPEPARKVPAVMKAQDVVLAAEPHDVILRFVHPVPVPLGSRLCGLRYLGRQAMAPVAKDPQEGNRHKVRAIPPLPDCRWRATCHVLGPTEQTCRPMPEGRDVVPPVEARQVGSGRLGRFRCDPPPGRISTGRGSGLLRRRRATERFISGPADQPVRKCRIGPIEANLSQREWQ